jgi:predicted RNase H-like HicB family nuclease
VPQNGYWIECIPVATGDSDKDDGQGADGLYRAEIASIPEANALAKTPDKAIQELRDKLSALRHDYCTRGKDLPEHDNPVRPPRNSKSTKGWISVYVQMNDCCKNI